MILGFQWIGSNTPLAVLRLSQHRSHDATRLVDAPPFRQLFAIDCQNSCFKVMGVNTWVFSVQASIMESPISIQGQENIPTTYTSVWRTGSIKL